MVEMCQLPVGKVRSGILLGLECSNCNKKKNNGENVSNLTLNFQNDGWNIGQYAFSAKVIN